MKTQDDALPRELEDIGAGRENIEDCLGRYPCLRGELEPLLKVALEIKYRRDSRVAEI